MLSTIKRREFVTILNRTNWKHIATNLHYIDRVVVNVRWLMLQVLNSVLQIVSIVQNWNKLREHTDFRPLVVVRLATGMLSTIKSMAHCVTISNRIYWITATNLIMSPKLLQIVNSVF